MSPRRQTQTADVVSSGGEAMTDPLQKRIDAALECPGLMCGHCIEILTGDIPPDTTLQEFTGPCTEFRRSHLYQIGCSDCGKGEAGHRTPDE
jgi:hypothetical protein